MNVTVVYGRFEWDRSKEHLNVREHGIDFKEAVKAFADTERIIATDDAHSQTEPRFFCIGLIEHKVLTVRFTPRGNRIRIIGAGFWRKGRQLYEQENT